MKDNSFISAMFEEIKSKISAIEKKLEKDDTPPGHPGTATKKDEKDKAITAEELLRLVQKTIIYSTQKELQHAIPQLQDSKNEILDGINELRISLKNLKCSRIKIKNDFGISNLKLWKTCSIVASALLLFCIIELKIENLRLADNDLKFRIYLLESRHRFYRIAQSRNNFSCKQRQRINKKYPSRCGRIRIKS